MTSHNPSQGDDGGALLWIAAALLAMLAHALLAALLLSPSVRTVAPPPPAAAEEVQLIDLPPLPATSATRPGPAPTSATPQPRATHSQRLRAFRAERLPSAPSPTLPAPPPAPPPRVTAAVSTAAHPATAAQPAAAALPGRPVIVNTPAALSALQLWESAMLAKLARFKRYPEDSRRRHEQDTVSLRISVDRSGKVLRVAIVHSRGFTLLDQEALQMAREADPLPPLPAELAGDHLNIVVPVEFFLLQGSALSGDPLQ